MNLERAEGHSDFWVKERVRSPDFRLRKQALHHLEGKRILVTGATGKIGSEIVRFLSTNPGIKIRANSLLSHNIINPQLEYLSGDLGSSAFVEELLEDVAVVFHLAAMTDPFLCQQDPQGAWQENFITTSNLLNALRGSAIELAVVSSGLMAVEKEVDDSPSVYGQTKYGTEKLWQEAARIYRDPLPETRFIIVRLGSVAEENGELGLTGFFRRQATRDGKIVVFDEKSSRKVISMDQVIDLLSFTVTEKHRCPTGSVVTRSDMPRIGVFALAKETAENWQELELPKRPEIVIIERQKAVRVKDIVLSPQEEKRAVGFGPYVVVAPTWRKVSQDIHLSFPVRGEKAVHFVYKLPAVVEFTPLRRVTEKKTMGDFPHTLEICPTPACNFACSHCSYTIRNTDLLGFHQDHISREAVFDTIDQLIKLVKMNIDTLIKGSQETQPLLGQVQEMALYPVPGIFIAGWGEPTVVPWLKEFISYAGDYFPVSLCTNASLLETTGLTDPTILSKIKMLLWSLYAPDKTSFPVICMSNHSRQDHFKNIEENINKVLEVRKREELDLKLAIKILITRENYPLIWQLYDYAQSFKPDRLVLRLANNFELGQNVELNSYERHILRQIILAHTTDQLHHPIRRFADIFLSEEEDYQKYVPEWVSACHHLRDGHFGMIDPDGEVYLSVSVDGIRNRSIGNITTNSWSDIWGGPEHQRQMKIAGWEYQHKRCSNKNGICRHNGANVVLERYNYLRPEDRGPFYPEYYLEDDGPFI